VVFDNEKSVIHGWKQVELSPDYLSQTWHGEHECVYACATSEMTQITKKLAVEWIAL